MAKKKKKKNINLLKHYQGFKSYIKGLLFEKVLENLLTKAGYSTNVSGLQVTRNQKRLHGRGATYDPDFFRQFSLGIPFINPLVLLLEAKYYNNRVGLKTVREFLGAYIDISQFTHINTKKGGNKRYSILFDTRYNYCPVLFSLKGFQRKSEGFMFAHGINFISYENSDIMTKIFKRLEELLAQINFSKLKKEDGALFEKLDQIVNIPKKAKRQKFNRAYEEFTKYINKVNSLIGVLDFKYPIHILYERNVSASYTRKLNIIQKKDNLFILENTAKRKFGEFSFSKTFLRDYIHYAKKRNFLDNIFTQIDVVQVKGDAITLRKLRINPESKQQLISQLKTAKQEIEENEEDNSDVIN